MLGTRWDSGGTDPVRTEPDDKRRAHSSQRSTVTAADRRGGRFARQVTRRDQIAKASWRAGSRNRGLASSPEPARRGLRPPPIRDLRVLRLLLPLWLRVESVTVLFSSRIRP